MDSIDAYDSSIRSPRQPELMEIVEFSQLNVRTLAEQLTRMDSVSSFVATATRLYACIILVCFHLLHAFNLVF